MLCIKASIQHINKIVSHFLPGGKPKDQRLHGTVTPLQTQAGILQGLSSAAAAALFFCRARGALWLWEEKGFSLIDRSVVFLSVAL